MVKNHGKYFKNTKLQVAEFVTYKAANMIKKQAQIAPETATEHGKNQM